VFRFGFFSIGLDWLAHLFLGGRRDFHRPWFGFFSISWGWDFRTGDLLWDFSGLRLLFRRFRGLRFALLVRIGNWRRPRGRLQRLHQPGLGFLSRF
jgi:hypothetical protein